MHYLIIGGSIAGVSAAKAIRGSDSDAEITMLSTEKGRPYYRPMIPAVIEKSDIDIALSDNPIEKYGINLVYDQAIGIDSRTKEVILSSRQRMNYDKLLVATGSKPVTPDVPGIEGPDVFQLRTVEDARNIQAAAGGRKHAVVLGGGFVGIGAAIALKRLGLTVTIIEKRDRILHGKLDKRGSDIISRLLKRAHIEIVRNQRYYEIKRLSGSVQSIRLASGRIIDADVVVIAVGTKPNTKAIRDSGIKINNGIVIQEFLQTSIPDIYAAGDVVEYRDLVSNTYSVCGSWTNAEEMGRLAGKNMAGEGIKYSGFLSLMNTLEILTVPVTTIGLIEPKTSMYEAITEEGKGMYRKLVFKNDIMVGALLIGSVENADMYAFLIKNEIPLGMLKEFAIQCQLGSLNDMNPETPSVSYPITSNFHSESK